MRKEDWQQIVRAFGLLTMLGIVMLSNMGVGFFLGYFLDNLFAMNLFFKILGLVLGVFSGFYANFRLIKDLFNNSSAEGDDEDV